MNNGFDDAMDIDMEHDQCERVSREHHGEDYEVRRANPKLKDRPHKNSRDELAQHYRHTNMPKHNGNFDGETPLSDLSLSADMCAQDVQQTHRSRNVRMTDVHFCDAVQTIDIIAHSETYDQPSKKFVLGNNHTYIGISRHACACTGLHKDEITFCRMKMAKSGR